MDFAQLLFNQPLLLSSLLFLVCIVKSGRIEGRVAKEEREKFQRDVVKSLFEWRSLFINATAFGALLFLGFGHSLLTSGSLFLLTIALIAFIIFSFNSRLTILAFQQASDKFNQTMKKSGLWQQTGLISIILGLASSNPNLQVGGL